jgi:hypothetical protein
MRDIVKDIIEREDRLAVIYAQPEPLWKAWEYTELRSMKDHELFAYLNICKMGVRIPGSNPKKLKRHGAICRDILIERGLL